MSKRHSSRAIILKDERILLMHRIKNGNEYYVFPGGGIEKGETSEQAVRREVLEESSIAVKVERLLYKHIYDDGTSQVFFLCQHISGEPKLGIGNESEEMKVSSANFFEPLWMELGKIPKMLLYPLEIRDWLIEDLQNSFKYTPKTATIRLADIRHQL